MKTLIFTGGHHNSSLEVAKSLKHQGVNIIWFGHKHSMWGDKNVSGEYIDVTSAKIDFIDLKAGKFFRTYNPIKLIRIPIGFIQSFIQITKIKNNGDLAGIVSFGGYLAIPVVVSGWLLGIPSITHEQTVVSGWANRVIANFALKVATSWPSNSNNPKFIYTGLPLREELTSSESKKDSKLIYVTGGKQGSHLLNKAIFELVSKLTKEYKVIHQTGSSSLYKDYETAETIKNEGYSYFTYDSQKAIEALKSAEVVISRSGAHTVYELAALTKKCVLIPIPWTSHDEQLKNAQLLEKYGQAIILNQNDLTPESLLHSIKQAFDLNPQKISIPLDSTSKIVNLIKTTLLHEKTNL